MAYAFENMNAWQEARKLVIEVYRLLDEFPKFETYALVARMLNGLRSSLLKKVETVNSKQ